MTFSAFTELSNYHLHLVPKYFHCSQRNFIYPVRSISLSISAQLFTTTNLLYASMHILVLGKSDTFCIWVASIFWLLWTVSLWTFMYNCLCVYLLFFFPLHLGLYLGVDALGHVVILLNFLRHCQMIFHSVSTILHSCQQCMRVSISLQLCQHLLFCIFKLLLLLLS